MISNNKINICKKLFLTQTENITAVASGYGSMGKTWFAVTLAYALNFLHKKVLLFDADNGLLSTDFQLDLNDANYLNQVVTDVISLNQAVVSTNRKKLDVIRGQAGSGILEEVPVGRLQILREEMVSLAENYDDVVMDMPSSDKIMANMLPASACLILLCTREPSNLVSTYDFLQKQADKFLQNNLQIVVNYANSYEEGLRTYNMLRRACERYSAVSPNLLGIIRRDTHVRDAIRNHVPLLNRYPASEAAVDVINIARKLWVRGIEN